MVRIGLINIDQFLEMMGSSLLQKRFCSQDVLCNDFYIFIIFSAFGG